MGFLNTTKRGPSLAFSFGATRYNTTWDQQEIIEKGTVLSLGAVWSVGNAVCHFFAYWNGTGRVTSSKMKSGHPSNYMELFLNVSLGVQLSDNWFTNQSIKFKSCTMQQLSIWGISFLWLRAQQRCIMLFWYTSLIQTMQLWEVFYQVFTTEAKNGLTQRHRVPTICTHAFLIFMKRLYRPSLTQSHEKSDKTV